MARPSNFTNEIAATVEIYALLDPADGSVRYIGKARDSAKRFVGHLREVRRRSPLYDWIWKLRASGLVPVLTVLETCAEADWKERERFHIADGRARGLRLLSLADGGDQPYCSPEVLKANGKKNAARMLEARTETEFAKRMWLAKKQIAVGLKKGWVSEGAKAKLRLAAAKRPDLFGEYARI